MPKPLMLSSAIQQSDDPVGGLILPTFVCVNFMERPPEVLGRSWDGLNCPLPSHTVLEVMGSYGTIPCSTSLLSDAVRSCRPTKGQMSGLLIMGSRVRVPPRSPNDVTL